MPASLHAICADSTTLVAEAFPTVREVIFCCHSPSDLAVYEQLLVDTD
jgi:hypothetical protein